MKLLLLSTFFASLLFLIIDILWLSFAVKYFYKPNIGNLLLDQPIIWAAALFYILYVFGVAVVIINPSLNSEIALSFIFKAFVFGLVAYGTYNLTNMATIKGWSSKVVVVDMFWGGFLTAFSSYYGILIAKKLIT